MNKVNLLIIGSGRSGTTSLYHYLDHHPEVCFSAIKEIHYFSFDDLNRRGEKYYHRFFEDLNKKVIASADTYLLIDKQAPDRVKRYNPDMRFMVLLRDPVERAYSSFIYSKNFGYENKKYTFHDAFVHEKQRIQDKDIIIQNNRGHFYSGLYHEHLRDWMQYFPKEHFLLLRTDDLKNHPHDFYVEVCRFLDISYRSPGEVIKKNVAQSSKIKALQQIMVNRNHPLRKFIRKVTPEVLKRLVLQSNLIHSIYQLNKAPAQYEPLTEEEKNQYKTYFKEDLEKLEKQFQIRV